MATQQDFETVLTRGNNGFGVTYVTFDAEGMATATVGGTGNPDHKRITHSTFGTNAQVYTNATAYKDQVNRERVKAGKAADFEEKPLPYGEFIKGSPFIHHNGVIQLRCYVLSVTKTVYYRDGIEIAKSDIIGLDTGLKYEAICDDGQLHWITYANYFALTYAGKPSVKLYKQPIRASLAGLTGNTKSAKENDHQGLGGDNGGYSIQPRNYGAGGIEKIITRMAAFKQVIS